MINFASWKIIYVLHVERNFVKRFIKRRRQFIVVSLVPIKGEAMVQQSELSLSRINAIGSQKEYALFVRMNLFIKGIIRNIAQGNVLRLPTKTICQERKTLHIKMEVLTIKEGGVVMIGKQLDWKYTNVIIMFVRSAVLNVRAKGITRIATI
jgi:hypothetical protein